MWELNPQGGVRPRARVMRRMRPWGIAVALAAALPGVLPATDITFFALSDTHFGNDNADYPQNRTHVVDVLNSLPGQQYPVSVGGGTIAKPRGVIIPGDLIDRVDTSLWRMYTSDYTVNGTGRLKYPVFDGLGNHDEPGNTKVFAMYKQRNATRTNIHLDSVNYHYSWDWDQVHFVNLNLYSGTVRGTGTGDPEGAVDFLKADLAKYVGNSGRPVFVFQHYQFDNGDSWWNWTEKQKTIDVLKGYNVIGLLHGHSHSKKLYKWQGYDVLDDGTAMNADCMVVRITDSRMFVVNKVKDEWGTLVLDKAISMGKPVAIPGAQAVGTLPEARLLVDGGTQMLKANGRFDRAEIRDLRGGLVRSLALVDGAAAWDRRDMRGATAVSGVYGVTFLGHASRQAMKLVLR